MTKKMILDIGCGYENPDEPYKKRGDIGIDIVGGYCDIIADAHSLPFRAGIFHGAYILSSIDHFKQPYKSLIEAKRVITNYLVLTVGNTDYWALSLTRTSNEHFYKWNVDTLKQLLIICGFNRIEYNLKCSRNKRFKEKFIELITRIFYKDKLIERFVSDLLFMKAYKV